MSIEKNKPSQEFDNMIDDNIEAESAEDELGVEDEITPDKISEIISSSEQETESDIVLMTEDINPEELNDTEKAGLLHLLENTKLQIRDAVFKIKFKFQYQKIDGLVNELARRHVLQGEGSQNELVERFSQYIDPATNELLELPDEQTRKEIAQIGEIRADQKSVDKEMDRRKRDSEIDAKDRIRRKENRMVLNEVIERVKKYL